MMRLAPSASLAKCSLGTTSIAPRRGGEENHARELMLSSPVERSEMREGDRDPGFAPGKAVVGADRTRIVPL
jgi:hypothetical protein